MLEKSAHKSHGWSMNIMCLKCLFLWLLHYRHENTYLSVSSEILFKALFLLTRRSD